MPNFSLIAKLIGMLTLVGVGFGLGYKVEHGDVLAAQSALTAYKADHKAASEKAKADQDAIVSTLQDDISQEAANHAQQIQGAYARNTQLALGLRICSANGSHNMPQAASASASGDGSGQPGIISVQAIVDLARDADRDRETALECQRWAAGIAK